jgi:adenosylcobinamide kinase / adenosylcobinamide-phosphate guanylyltransferase
MTSRKTLVIGGARSGKSAWAERQAAAAQCPVTVVVTGQALDGEMAERIALHRAQRPAHWRTVEAPLALAGALQREARSDGLLVVDCLTLWLTNLLLAEGFDDTAVWRPSATYRREVDALLDGLPALPGQVLLIGNEVGHGIVPMGALNRVFVDENGRLHQALAQRCDAVRFVMAGCVLPLKG